MMDATDSMACYLREYLPTPEAAAFLAAAIGSGNSEALSLIALHTSFRKGHSKLLNGCWMTPDKGME